MKQELVEKVAKGLGAALYGDTPHIPWEQAAPEAQERWRRMARYALALAERAAEEAVREYRTGSMANPVEPAVERAVEGA